MILLEAHGGTEDELSSLLTGSVFLTNWLNLVAFSKWTGHQPASYTHATQKATQETSVDIPIIAERETKAKFTVRLSALGGFYTRKEEMKDVELKSLREGGV